MARLFTAYLVRSDVPALGALQQAIATLRFKLVLDDAYKPFESAGYLPCSLDGEDGGFDLRVLGVEADPAPAAVQAQLGGRDVAMAMRWGGDPREKACVLMVCAALAEDFGALVLDGECDCTRNASELIEMARVAAEL